MSISKQSCEFSKKVVLACRELTKQSLGEFAKTIANTPRVVGNG